VPLRLALLRSDAQASPGATHYLSTRSPVAQCQPSGLRTSVTARSFAQSPVLPLERGRLLGGPAAVRELEAAQYCTSCTPATTVQPQIALEEARQPESALAGKTPLPCVADERVFGHRPPDLTAQARTRCSTAVRRSSGSSIAAICMHASRAFIEKHTDKTPMH
jgi:hypothetical protein